MTRCRLEKLEERTNKQHAKCIWNERNYNEKYSKIVVRRSGQEVTEYSNSVRAIKDGGMPDFLNLEDMAEHNLDLLPSGGRIRCYTAMGEGVTLNRNGYTWRRLTKEEVAKRKKKEKKRQTNKLFIDKQRTNENCITLWTCKFVLSYVSY